jgi:hypothetical protein
MKPKAAATFLSLVVPCGLFFAILWSWLAPKYLYNCAEPVPLRSFIPPFLHDHAGKDADTLIASDLTVYATWFGFVLASFLAPLVLTYMVMRAFRHNRWRELRRTVSSRPPTMRADTLPQGK